MQERESDTRIVGYIINKRGTCKTNDEIVYGNFWGVARNIQMKKKGEEKKHKLNKLQGGDTSALPK